jgi:3-dehydroquinate synthase class II
MLLSSSSREDRLAAEGLFWAWEEVEDLIAARGEEAVDLVVALADADDAELGYLGAGPVESLLSSQPPPPEVVLCRLEEAARSNPRVRVAVGSVWWDEEDEPELRRRFERFRE